MPIATGGYHVELNDKPTTSTGEVKRIYSLPRDYTMLSFPCHEVNARFDHGMSGRIVVDESGALCGPICCSLPADNPEDYAVSHVTTPVADVAHTNLCGPRWSLS
jgi:hypothetical protein